MCSAAVETGRMWHEWSEGREIREEKRYIDYVIITCERMEKRKYELGMGIK